MSTPYSFSSALLIHLTLLEKHPSANLSSLSLPLNLPLRSNPPSSTCPTIAEADLPNPDPHCTADTPRKLSWRLSLRRGWCCSVSNAGHIADPATNQSTDVMLKDHQFDAHESDGRKSMSSRKSSEDEDAGFEAQKCLGGSRGLFAGSAESVTLGGGGSEGEAVADAGDEGESKRKGGSL
ncbi:hypothetical protein W97_00016 [Coniosporium apollinis CBS 100218]|uniref:Uncharacterized protein n=1 Tax=Coniosporium apollinis (strain CBS 100218) TaxID=1168221 RepID=R7YFX6_CONA1|nr:uncharacterized protein W97_00016 [Coniosporium apollinis CBS 100218]EON60807.1 hypothetical protein W97_00016 [Coniosporium apollinis CBS 100218]